MRILFVNPFWEPYRGGIEKVIERLSMIYMSGNKFDSIGILTSKHLYPKGDNTSARFLENKDDIQVYRCNFFPANIPFITNLSNSGYISFEIKKVIDDFKPDVVQFMTDGWYLPNLLISFLLPKNTFQSFSPYYHDLPNSIFSLPMRMCNRILSNRVNAIQVVSKVEMEKIGNIYHAPKEKTTVIPLGFDVVKNFNKLVKNKEYIQILTVGRIGSAKNQFNLVKVTKEIHDKYHNVRLVLVGKDGGDLDKINKYIDDNTMGSYVEIQNSISDQELHKIYNQSDIYVSTSLYESFGLTLIEALSHEIPVVAFDVGGISESFPKGSILIPPYDYSKIKEAIISLMVNESLRSSLSIEGKKFIEKKYSWEHTAKQYINLYSQ